MSMIRAITAAAMAFACAAGAYAAPVLEWKSPFEGPCVNVHIHASTANLPVLEKQIQQAIDNQIILMLISSHQNADVMQDLMRKYPGSVYSLGWIEPDKDDWAERIDIYHKAGYKGLKFATYVTNPRGLHEYSYPGYRPIFEKAAELGLTCVFHTNTTELGLKDHPVHIDTLQREVPGLKVVGYHLANPNFEVAGELMLKNRNLFFEMSGITQRMVEQHYLGPDAGRELILDKFRNALWHPQMWSQIMFASDSMMGNEPRPAEGPAADAPPGPGHATDHMLHYKELYRDWLTTLEAPEEIQYKIMYDNAAQIFDLPKRPGAEIEGDQ